MVKHSHVVGIVVAAFLVWGALSWFGGYLAHQAFVNSEHHLGAQTINYSNSGGSTNLYNELASELTDITNVRNSLSGLAGANATFPAYTLGPLSASTSTASTSISLTGAAVGDFVLVGESTSTGNVSVSAVVTAANTAIVWKQNNALSTSVLSTDTVYVLLIPKGSFAAPAALNTSTSTSN